MGFSLQCGDFSVLCRLASHGFAVMAPMSSGPSDETYEVSKDECYAVQYIGEMAAK
jgi:hypothetical protein